MAREQYINGRTTDEKFTSVNKTLQHLARRSNKAVGVYVPPALISAYIEVPSNGVIYKQIFPVAGALANLCCLIEKLPPKTSSVTIEVTMKYPNNTGEKVTFEGKKVLQTANIDKTLPAGTLVTIALLNPSVECSGIWLAGTFTMTLNKTKLHTAIVDELENAYARLQEYIQIDERAVEQKKPSTELTDIINSIKS